MPYLRTSKHTGVSVAYESRHLVHKRGVGKNRRQAVSVSQIFLRDFITAVMMNRWTTLRHVIRSAAIVISFHCQEVNKSIRVKQHLLRSFIDFIFICLIFWQASILRLLAPD